MTSAIVTQHPRPTEEPPERVDSEILWRLAMRQFREHDHADAPVDRCVRCGQPWPCSGRRLAELGLAAARHGARFSTNAVGR